MIKQDLEKVINASEEDLRDILTEVENGEKEINDAITEIQILVSEGFC